MSHLPCETVPVFFLPVPYNLHKVSKMAILKWNRVSASGKGSQELDILKSLSLIVSPFIDSSMQAASENHLDGLI